MVLWINLRNTFIKKGSRVIINAELIIFIIKTAITLLLSLFYQGRVSFCLLLEYHLVLQVFLNNHFSSKILVINILDCIHVHRFLFERCKYKILLQVGAFLHVIRLRLQFYRVKGASWRKLKRAEIVNLACFVNLQNVSQNINVFVSRLDK